MLVEEIIYFTQAGNNVSSIAGLESESCLSLIVLEVQSFWVQVLSQ